MELNDETQLTENFKYGEFFCDGIQLPDEYYPNILALAKELQKLRDYYKKPIIINSGWRTEEHNKEVGGAKNSMHLKGLAADVRPPYGVNVKEFYVKARELTNFKGYGIGQNFLHCDLRSKLTIWYY
jgi:uncharacterized protein YcbK (DUF882 family)